MDRPNKEQPKPSRSPQKTYLFNYDDFPLLEDEKRALITQASPIAKWIMITIGLFITIALVWASFAILDEITRADGKVISSRDTQVIQYLEGGIIKEILVQEGDIVESGQVLLIIDKTKFNADYDEQRAKLHAIEGSLSRLRAEITEANNVDFPAYLVEAAPDVIQSETALFNSRQKELQSSIDTVKSSFELANSELNIISPLVKKGIMSEVELLKLKRTVNELKGKISALKTEFISKSHEELTAKEAEKKSLNSSLLALKDRINRTTIRSPVYGKIIKRNVNTIGSVIQSGSDIIEILPLDDSLLIEAQVKPEDIAFIHPGQKAVIKFTAYDFAIFGGLDGIVEYISADTIRDEDDYKKEDEYYKVLIRTHESHLGDGKKSLPVLPGMLVTVDILTGKKTVMDYLLKPFLKARQEALRER